MATRTKWTEEEDQVLVQAIKANPHNKAQVFREVAEKVNHPKTSCSTRWYNVLSNPENKHYVGACFTMIGMASNLANRSVSREGVHITPIKTKRSLWSKIKKILGL